MNEWDEKIYLDSIARDLCPGGFEDQDAFMIGARWQREALLSDESVERAARALNAAGWTCVDGAHEPGDYDDCPYCRGTCADMARAALTAAIGDDDE